MVVCIPAEDDMVVWQNRLVSACGVWRRMAGLIGSSRKCHGRVGWNIPAMPEHLPVGFVIPGVNLMILGLFKRV
jgi:hypothetical protein